MKKNEVIKKKIGNNHALKPSHKYFKPIKKDFNKKLLSKLLLVLYI